MSKIYLLKKIKGVLKFLDDFDILIYQFFETYQRFIIIFFLIFSMILINYLIKKKKNKKKIKN